MRLNLGSGNDYKQGYVNVDLSPDVNADLVIDVTKDRLPYDDNSIDETIAIDFFEHILYPIPVLNELWRVTKSGGSLYIEVPLAGTNDYYKDPTHVRPFVEETFKYFADYARSYTAIGCKPWNIAHLETKGSRIYCKLTLEK